MPTQFDVGFLVGLLVGEGHFGGDGRQAQVTLRMHVRHEAIFQWLERTFPGGRLYGPYHHGGRDYLQWMARGPYLRDELVPLLDRWLSPDLDRHSFDRFQLMKSRYPQAVADPAVPGAPTGPPGSPGHVAPGTPRPHPARPTPRTIRLLTYSRSFARPGRPRPSDRPAHYGMPVDHRPAHTERPCALSFLAHHPTPNRDDVTSWRT